MLQINPMRGTYGLAKRNILLSVGPISESIRKQKNSWESFMQYFQFLIRIGQKNCYLIIINMINNCIQSYAVVLLQGFEEKK